VQAPVAQVDDRQGGDDRDDRPAGNRLQALPGALRRPGARGGRRRRRARDGVVETIERGGRADRERHAERDGRDHQDREQPPPPHAQRAQRRGVGEHLARAAGETLLAGPQKDQRQLERGHLAVDGDLRPRRCAVVVATLERQGPAREVRHAELPHRGRRRRPQAHVEGPLAGPPGGHGRPCGVARRRRPQRLDQQRGAAAALRDARPEAGDLGVRVEEDLVLAGATVRGYRQRNDAPGVERGGRGDDLARLGQERSDRPQRHDGEDREEEDEQAPSHRTAPG
jgi:hypothetical protein